MPKKLSILKKKLLLERWKNALPEGSELNIAVDSSTSSNDPTSPVALGYLFVVNYMSVTDLLEKEELDEIVNELIELIKPHTTGAGTDGGVKKILFSEDKCVLRLTMSSVEYATSASQYLNGLVIGGQQLYSWVTSIGNMNWLSQSSAATTAEATTQKVGDTGAGTGTGTASAAISDGNKHEKDKVKVKSKGKSKEKNKKFVDVRLLNVLFEDDFPVGASEPGGDHSEEAEEVQEMLSDVQTLCMQTCGEEVLSVSFTGKNGRRGSTNDASVVSSGSSTSTISEQSNQKPHAASSMKMRAEATEPAPLHFLEDIGGKAVTDSPLVLVELSKSQLGSVDEGNNTNSPLLRMFRLFEAADAQARGSANSVGSTDRYNMWLRAPQGSNGAAGSSCFNLYQLHAALKGSKTHGVGVGVGKYSVGIKLYQFVDSSSEVASLPVRSGPTANSAVAAVDEDIAAEYSELQDDCISILQMHAGVTFSLADGALDTASTAGTGPSTAVSSSTTDSSGNKLIEYQSVFFVKPPVTGSAATALDAVVVLSSMSDCCVIMDALFNSEQILAGSQLHADIVFMTSEDVADISSSMSSSSSLSVLASSRVHSLHSTRRTVVNNTFSLLLQPISVTKCAFSTDTPEVQCKKQVVEYLTYIMSATAVVPVTPTALDSPVSEHLLAGMKESFSAVRYYSDLAAVTALTAPVTVVDTSKSKSTHSSSHSKSLITTVRCLNYASALNVVLSLDGVVVGGQSVSASIVSQSIPAKAGSSKGQSKSNKNAGLKLLDVTNIGGVGAAIGEPDSASSQTQPQPQLPLSNSVAVGGSTGKTKKKVRSLWQQLLGSKYDEAATCPKLPKHNSLTLLSNESTNVVNNNSFILNTQHLKTSTIQIDLVIKQLVSVLAVVQQNDYESSTVTALNTAANSKISVAAPLPDVDSAAVGNGVPGKSKTKGKAPAVKPPANAAATGAMKVIMGLKQVTQYIARHNKCIVDDAGSAAGEPELVPVPGAIPGAADLKLVLLAPDTENSVELDKQILKLVNACNSHSCSFNPQGTVPILYCLSRRQLGKICQSSLRQAAVGIVSITPVSALDSAAEYNAFNQIYTGTNNASGGASSSSRASAIAARGLQRSSQLQPSVEEVQDHYYNNLLTMDPPLTAQFLLQNVPQEDLVGYCRWLYSKVVEFVNS